MTRFLVVLMLSVVTLAVFGVIDLDDTAQRSPQVAATAPLPSPSSSLPAPASPSLTHGAGVEAGANLWLVVGLVGLVAVLLTINTERGKRT